ncbi:MAG: hypothetical protein KatS3mg098_185 [Candidatus Parcubacteria bacterium]|nr:MAG: hypothetical protein KatS3mg098_185 [Candidatus Parcubacteria bacterium]
MHYKNYKLIKNKKKRLYEAARERWERVFGEKELEIVN